MKLWVLTVAIFLSAPPGAIANAGTVADEKGQKNDSPLTPGTVSFDHDLMKEESLSTPIGKAKDIRLIHLNHHINKWFLLKFSLENKVYSYHLENVNPKNIVGLSKEGLSLRSGTNPRHQILCSFKGEKGFKPDPATLAMEKHTYYPVCNNLVFIRLNQPSDTRLTLTEITTGFLRSLPVGESIINYLKPFLVGLDAESDSGILQEKKENVRKKVSAVLRNAKPEPVRMRDIGNYSLVSGNNNLGIKINNEGKNPEYGAWYETSMHPGIHVSLFKPELIHEEIYSSHQDKVFALKPDEKNKLVYITAYNLEDYTLNYALGTQHPAVNISAQEFTASSWIRKSIVPVGSIPPYEIRNAVGVFIGGFKNRHGIFKSGPYEGRTYGYIENGLELEPMSPMLATLLVSKDGEVTVRKWPEHREQQLQLRKKTVSARQNGTLLLHNGAPGEFVSNWAHGNWSGSAEGLGQSLRAGVCIQETQGKKFLLFMAFTSATPSAMARVMQAYSCRDGMHLDMNAHMYLHNAIYNFDRESETFQVEYLHTEMLYPKDLKRHRFIMDNNKRDFFYIKRRTDDPDLFVKH